MRHFLMVAHSVFMGVWIGLVLFVSMHSMALPIPFPMGFIMATNLFYVAPGLFNDR